MKLCACNICYSCKTRSVLSSDSRLAPRRLQESPTHSRWVATAVSEITGQSSSRIIYPRIAATRTNVETSEREPKIRKTGLALDALPDFATFPLVSRLIIMPCANTPCIVCSGQGTSLDKLWSFTVVVVITEQSCNRRFIINSHETCETSNWQLHRCHSLTAASVSGAFRCNYLLLLKLMSLNYVIFLMTV